jgi:hypothetical protein
LESHPGGKLFTVSTFVTTSAPAEVSIVIAGVGLIVGVSLGTGDGVWVGSGVSVGVEVAGGMGAAVGLGNCPDPQAESNILAINKRKIMLRWFVFILSSCAITGAPGDCNMDRMFHNIE